jgi:hypothetical protein
MKEEETHECIKKRKGKIIDVTLRNKNRFFCKGCGRELSHSQVHPSVLERLR